MTERLLRPPVVEVPVRLTPRENDVMVLAAQGHSAGDIAGHLFLAPTTVKTHLHSAYAKLGARNRSSAVAQALRLGVLQ